MAKDIIDIVREETRYFIPQIETKIMNEGGQASGTTGSQQAGTAPEVPFEFLRRHNQIIRPTKAE